MISNVYGIIVIFGEEEIFVKKVRQSGGDDSK